MQIDVVMGVIISAKKQTKNQGRRIGIWGVGWISIDTTREDGKKRRECHVCFWKETFQTEEQVQRPWGSSDTTCWRESTKAAVDSSWGWGRWSGGEHCWSQGGDRADQLGFVGHRRTVGFILIEKGNHWSFWADIPLLYCLSSLPFAMFLWLLPTFLFAVELKGRGSVGREPLSFAACLLVYVYTH